MSTTVEVKKSTLQRLEELKKKFRAKSVDGTIRNLTMQAQGIPRSKFGAHSEMKPFTSEDEAKGHEL